MNEIKYFFFLRNICILDFKILKYNGNVEKFTNLMCAA